jgi:uncharacterized membrane protein
MLLKSPSSKLLLGVATLAMALGSGNAIAGTPDRTATAPWGKTSILWLTDRPAASKASADLTPDAAPRDAVHGEQISGSHGMMGHDGMMMGKMCSKMHHNHVAMKAAHHEAMAANAPLHQRLEVLHGEVKAIWTAKTFDRDAFLAKRAEMRDLQNKIEQNMDTAHANAAATMSPEQRAEVTTCWFHRHHHWFHKKMHGRHHGAHKKHHAHGVKHHSVHAVGKVPVTQPEAEHAKAAEPPKTEDKK